MARSRQQTPDECAVCGAAIPRHAHACPECGADERTGWREQDTYDGLDLPDSAWEDDSAPRPRQLRRSLAWYWWATAALVLAGLLLGLLGR